jgi:RNA polymerase sigma factor (sigma-70 family)
MDGTKAAFPPPFVRPRVAALDRTVERVWNRPRATVLARSVPRPVVRSFRSSTEILLPRSRLDDAPTDARALFLQEVERIERIVGSIARSRSLAADDADDFRSFVHERLIDNDYAILRKFEGRSSVGTFLTVVITRLYLDFRNAQWGRWRPSAAAKRMGSWAVRLESLLSREGYSLDEAVQVIRTGSADAPDEAHLRELAARLPTRTPVGRPSGRPLASLPADAAADDAVLDEARTRARSRIADALEAALAELPSEDRLILQLRFWENLSVADISRTLHLEQKPLYGRIEANLKRLRAALAARGFGGDALADWEIGE